MEPLSVRINPKKLLNSKWTAIEPKNKEKHFIVINVEFDELGAILVCELEAVLSKRVMLIQWRELMDNHQWEIGWK